MLGRYNHYRLSMRRLEPVHNTSDMNPRIHYGFPSKFVSARSLVRFFPFVGLERTKLRPKPKIKTISGMKSQRGEKPRSTGGGVHPLPLVWQVVVYVPRATRKIPYTMIAKTRMRFVRDSFEGPTRLSYSLDFQQVGSSHGTFRVPGHDDYRVAFPCELEPLDSFFRLGEDSVC